MLAPPPATGRKKCCGSQANRLTVIGSNFRFLWRHVFADQFFEYRFKVFIRDRRFGIGHIDPTFFEILTKAARENNLSICAVFNVGQIFFIRAKPNFTQFDSTVINVQLDNLFMRAA